MVQFEKSDPIADFRAFEATPGMRAIVFPDSPAFTLASVSRDLIVASALDTGIIGSPYFELYAPTSRNGAHIAARLRQSFLDVMETKKTHELLIDHYPLPGNGETIFKHCSISHTPILNGRGEVDYIIQTIVDATQQVQAQEKLSSARAIEKDYRFFMDAPVIIGYLSGEDYTIELANEGLLKVWSRTRDVVGKPLLKAMPELERQGIKQLLDRVRLTGEPFFAHEFPISFNRGDKTETLYFDFVYKPFYENENDEVASGVISVGHDVTEQVNARQLFKNVVEQATDPIVILKGRDMILEGANDALLRLWNIDKSAMGKTLLQIVPGMKEQGFFDLLQKVYTTGETVQGYEVPVVFERAADQKRSMYFNFTYQPYREAGGEISGVLVLASDATDQVLARRSAEASQMKWKNLANSMPAIVWIANPDGSIRFFNDRWYELTGLTASESLGTGWLKVLFPDDIDKCLKAWEAARDNARFFEVEVRYRNRHGDYCWVIIRGAPVTQEGRVVSWYGATTDINKQKELELHLEEKVRARTEELESKNKLLDNILSHSSNGIAVSEMVFDNSGNVVDAMTILANDSAVKFSGIPRDMYLSKPATAFDPDIMRSPYGQTCMRTLTTGEPSVTQYFIDFSSKWLELTISKMDDSHLIHIFTDVTPIKQAQLQLEKSLDDLRYANKNLEEFAYAASHDLKEPVRKIQFFSNRLREDLREQLNDVQVKLFDRLESSSARMQNLIDDLLEYSQAARGSSEQEDVDLNAVIAGVLEDLELEIGKKQARINVVAMPAIKANKRQMQQLFQNLISNALKYSKPGVLPEVRIASRVVKGKEVLEAPAAEVKEEIFHLITVSDNGIGFEQKYADSIFNVFTRLDSAVESRGSGIGLAIVKRVVEGHHGRVWAQSEPGKGSTFNILFPAT